MCLVSFVWEYLVHRQCVSLSRHRGSSRQFARRGSSTRLRRTSARVDPSARTFISKMGRRVAELEREHFVTLSRRWLNVP